MTEGRTGSACRIDAGELTQWAASALTASGVPDEDARLVAGSLVQTSLWGIDTHGIARLPHYLRRLDAGSTRPRPSMAFTRTAAATGTLDGDHGLGIVVCERAMREAVSLASESGVGVVGCRHSTHGGALGLYGRQAVRAGMIGLAFTHADAIVAPHGGSRAFLGTNPICIAVPNADGAAVCLDMATSAIPFNRVMNARRDGESLPPGVAVDASGQPTTDATAASALRPVGEHKGYALAFLIDILCGPLNGMPFGPHIPAMYGDLSARRNLGSLMIALDPARFAGGVDLARRVADMAAEARTQPPADPAGEVLVPGDPEYRCERERKAQGIPIEPGLAEEIVEWAGRFGLSPPAALH